VRSKRGSPSDRSSIARHVLTAQQIAWAVVPFTTSRLCRSQASARALSQQVTLHLGKCRHDVEEEPARRRGRVDHVRQRLEGDPVALKVLDERDELRRSRRVLPTMSIGMNPGPMTMPTGNGCVPAGEVPSRSFWSEGRSVGAPESCTGNLLTEALLIAARVDVIPRRAIIRSAAGGSSVHQPTAIRPSVPRRNRRDPYASGRTTSRRSCDAPGSRRDRTDRAYSR